MLVDHRNFLIKTYVKPRILTSHHTRAQVPGEEPAVALLELFYDITLSLLRAATKTCEPMLFIKIDIKILFPDVEAMGGRVNRFRTAVVTMYGRSRLELHSKRLFASFANFQVSTTRY